MPATLIRLPMKSLSARWTVICGRIWMRITHIPAEEKISPATLPASFRTMWRAAALSRVSFLIAAVMEAGRIAFSFMWERCLRIVLLKTERLWRFLRCAGF